MKAAEINAELMGSIPWYPKLIACVKEVYRSLGHGNGEVKYQRALSMALTECKIDHNREVAMQMLYRSDDVPIGKGIVDFLIEGQAIVELKTLAGSIRKEDVNQLHKYLLHTGIQLGLLINFPKHFKLELTVVVLVRSDKKLTPLPPPIKLTVLSESTDAVDSDDDDKEQVKRPLTEVATSETKFSDDQLQSIPLSRGGKRKSDQVAQATDVATTLLCFPKRRWETEETDDEQWSGYDLIINAPTHKRHKIQFKGKVEMN
jgi:GxxExxY protein